MPVDQNILQQFFNQYYGRQGSADEINYISQFLDQGHLGAFEGGQLIAGQPEAQRRMFDQNAAQYEQALAGSDETILGKAGKQITGRMAALGRPDSSGFASSYLSAAKDLATNRQPALAAFYGQGLNNLQNQYYGASQGVQGRANNLQDAYRQRAWDVEDYYRQQNDYNTYLNASNRRGRFGFLGSLAGGALGGYLGGPGGARAGAGIGQGLGGFF